MPAKRKPVLIAALLAFVLQAQAGPGDKPAAEPPPEGTGRGWRPFQQSPVPPQIFAAPRVTESLAGGRVVRLAPDALLAEEVVAIGGVHLVSEDRTVLGPPFRMTMPAGTPAKLRLIGERRSPCVFPDNELRDGRDQFVEICFLDRDGDGRYERARFIPAERGTDPRELTVQPIGFRPDPARAATAIFTAGQRLRIVAIGESRATILREASIGSGGVDKDAHWLPYPDGNGSRATLALRPGGRTRLAGLILAVQPDGAGGWSVAVEGLFEPWVDLRENDTAVQAGSTSWRIN